MQYLPHHADEDVEQQVGPEKNLSSSAKKVAFENSCVEPQNFFIF
jgi:hypothetical protein